MTVFFKYFVENMRWSNDCKSTFSSSLNLSSFGTIQFSLKYNLLINQAVIGGNYIRRVPLCSYVNTRGLRRRPHEYMKSNYPLLVKSWLS